MSGEGFSFGVVILAAGASRRMGRPKMLLPWGETTLLGHLVGQWRSLGATQIGVVCRAGDEAIERELKRLKFQAGEWIINARAEEGMFSSVQAAAKWDGWNQELTHFLITLGDQPEIERETLAGLVRFARENREAICQPSFRGRAKHPIILPKGLFHELARSNAETMRDFLERYEPRRRSMVSGDEGLAVDLDEWDNYEAAIQRMAERGAQGRV